ncbi:MAG: hypothetical protein ABFD92_09055 [Planctomycetaceae bacterium]|nr:hypothetical protein [Planctomycetaceae bacterium]
MLTAYPIGMTLYKPERCCNGYTLICSSQERRAFEVTPEKEIVWEHVGNASRSYRYPYDFCPPAAALGRPKEIPVTPPTELRIAPDAPLE